MFLGGFAYSKVGTAKPYDPAAVVYFSAMAVQPDAARKALINNLILGLKSVGIWAKLDWLSLFAMHTAQAARLNAVNPARSFSVVGAPVFTVDRGYVTTSGSNYLNSLWSPATSGVNYRQNSAHIGVWTNLNGANTTNGLLGNAPSRLSPRNGTGSVTAAVNSTNFGVVIADGTGHTVGDRSAAAAGKIIKNGAQFATFTTTSTALTTDSFYACGYNNGGAYAQSFGRIGALHWGGHLTDLEHAALYARLNAYLAAVGGA